MYKNEGVRHGTGFSFVCDGRFLLAADAWTQRNSSLTFIKIHLLHTFDVFSSHFISLEFMWLPGPRKAEGYRGAFLWGVGDFPRQ